jgi:hypothetical protein
MLSDRISAVMAGLVPAIHVLVAAQEQKHVDTRHEAGHYAPGRTAR